MYGSMGCNCTYFCMLRGNVVQYKRKKKQEMGFSCWGYFQQVNGWKYGAPAVYCTVWTDLAFVFMVLESLSLA